MSIRIHRLPAAFAAAALLVFASGVQARSLICESQDGNTRYCPTDTRGGVYLSVQYSKSSCRQGRTWGYDNRGIWVSNGCRAQFDIGDYRSGHRSDGDSKAAAALAIGLIGAAAIAAHNNRDRRDDRDDRDYDYRPNHHDYGASDHVTCESRDRQYQYCPANLRHASVDIDRQISRTDCRHGVNWGWDRGGVWVNDGCSAVFSIY